MVEWKVIEWLPEFCGLYAVNNVGDIKSLRATPRLLKQSHSRKYSVVKFSNDGFERSFLVHRLVARAFIAIPERYTIEGLGYNDLEVNHKNGDPSDNRVTNLEWCTRTENIEHAVSNGLMAQGKKGGKHPRARKIAMYDLEGSLIRVFDSVASTADFFGSKCRAHISSVCRGKRYSAFCHIFRYVDNEEAVETKISVPKLPRASLDQIKRKDYDTFRSAGHSSGVKR